MTQKELLEQRAALILEASKLMDTAQADSRSLSAEEEQKFDRLMADADGVDVQLNQLRRQATLAAKKGELSKPAARIASAARQAASHSDDEYRTAFFNYLRTGDRSEVRAMSITGTSGYTVPTTTEARIVEKLFQDSIVRQIATVRQTPDDRKIPLETGVPTAGIIGEASSITASDATFSQATVDAYKYASRVVASRELLDDSAFDLESYLIDRMTLAIARDQDEDFWDGTNSSMPQGVIQGMTTATTQKYQLSAGQTTSITAADDIMDWIYLLPPQYRAGAVILTSDEVIKNLRKIKQNSQYIWLSSSTETLLAGGAPGTIMGIPYYISAYPDALAASKYVAVYGNFRYYEIFDRGATEILVDPYTNASTWQVQMMAVRRTDAVRTNDDAFRVLQTSAT